MPNARRVTTSPDRSNSTTPGASGRSPSDRVASETSPRRTARANIGEASASVVTSCSVNSGCPTCRTAINAPHVVAIDDERGTQLRSDSGWRQQIAMSCARLGMTTGRFEQRRRWTAAVGELGELVDVVRAYSLWASTEKRSGIPCK